MQILTRPQALNILKHLHNEHQAVNRHRRPVREALPDRLHDVGQHGLMYKEISETNACEAAPQER